MPTRDETTPETRESVASSPPTFRQMLALWVPLAASIVMMVLEPSIINIGLSRTKDPELALAAYGVAFGLALVIEAPILMLLDASVARSADYAAFALVRRFTVWLGLGVTAIGLIVSFTPLYFLIVGDLMSIPTAVASLARPTLQVLTLWSMPIAWRRTHQGLLIRLGRTAIISMATGVRLLTLAVALVGGLLLLPSHGATVAGLAMVVSVAVEAVLITLAARPILRSDAFRGHDSSSGAPSLTLPQLWRFYRPLAVTTILRQTTRPVLNAGIAAAEMALASLAVWPVAWGLTMLISGPAWSLQQLATAMVTDQAAYRKVRGFALSLSALLSLLLALVAFTPLYGLVMGGIYNLSPQLQALARPTVQILTFYPLMMGAQSLLRGILIRSGRTGAVRTAMLVNVSVLVGALAAGILLFSPTGVVLAALATMAGAAAELIWLRFRRR